jgi:hypothetical protein
VKTKSEPGEESMPPAKRTRGGKAGGQSAQSGTVKLTLPVRESNQDSLCTFAKCFPTITHMEDCIGIADEMVPVKFRGKQLTLDTGRTLIAWEPVQKDSPQGQLTFTEGGTQKTVPAFMKCMPLINGYNWLRYKDRPNLPFFWSFQPDDCLQSCNQAYVDAVASFLANKAAQTVRSQHICDFYGCFRGVADTFFYNLEDDFEDFRFTNWFWDGFDKEEFGLRIIERNSGRRLTKEEMFEQFRPDKEFLQDDMDSESDDSSEDDSESSNSIGAESLPSEFETTEPRTPFGVDTEGIHFTTRGVSLSQSIGTASSFSTASHTDTDCSFSDEYIIHAECFGMPVVTMFLEQMEGAMDDLLEQSEHAPIQTADQETRWLAWLFQVCAACAQLQSILHLTHNDLHTNNVMFKRTTQEWVYYKDTGGTVWRIPTFGYIFTIIDYGRAIFTISGYTMISSDYDDGHDAFGMYNFGPIEDETQPRVHPNRSFDLCRLSCSLLRGLFPVNPVSKEKGMILTKEGTWEVRETTQAVFNLIWGWLKCKDGTNCLETETGDEKYPDFSLYIQIAANVHSAVPRDQIVKQVFRKFIHQSGAPTTQSCSFVPT